MKILHSGLVAIAAVVFILANQSEGNMTAALSGATQLERVLVSKDFQKLQDDEINAGKDIESVMIREAINGIKKSALKCQADGVPAYIVNTVLEGILTSVRLTLSTTNNLAKVVEKALSLKADPDAAIEVLKNGSKIDEGIVYIIGVPIHDAQGAGLALAGAGAQPGLKKSIIAIQNAGTAALEAFEVVEEVFTVGLKAGGSAVETSAKAAREVIDTVSLAALTYVNEAAEHAWEALRTAFSMKPRLPDLAPGIIDSLKTKVTTDNPEALSSIARLDIDLDAVLKKLTKKCAIDSAKMLYEGVKGTITETGDAISVAKKTIKEAGNLATTDTEAAVAALRKGFKVALDEIISGSAYGYLGLGAAGQNCGEKAIDGLVPAVLEIEHGRVSAYEIMKRAEKISVTAFRAGELAAVQGILTAIQMCDAAGSVLFTQFADGAEIGFDVLLSV